MSEPSEVKITSINTSLEKGTIKAPCDRAEVDLRGIVGDAHAGDWHRQISVLAGESIEQFEMETGRAIGPGEFGENLIVQGVDLRSASILDRFVFGAVELEVTQIGKKCHGENCEIFQATGRCIMPKEGLFCRVLSGGQLCCEDVGRYVPKVLDIRVITLSDRASAGVYDDRSGPRIRQLIEEHFAGRRWRTTITNTILPDDPEALRAALDAALAGGADAVFTTGGTGIGPRDSAPEAVSGFCRKIIPGIMELVRLKYGRSNPNALLSRSVAGTAGEMQVYALPGSVKAVQEYMGEILKTFTHVVCMLHGLDVH
jgi:molybdenum cofactor synthesis domain-containing protein